MNGASSVIDQPPAPNLRTSVATPVERQIAMAYTWDCDGHRVQGLGVRLMEPDQNLMDRQDWSARAQLLVDTTSPVQLTVMSETMHVTKGYCQQNFACVH